MAIPFLIAIDLNKNELQNARIQNLAADPSTPVQGQIYFNTTDNTIREYTGAAWRVMAYVGSTTPGTETVGQAAVVGTSNEAARADHAHATPGVATAGVSGFMPGTDKTKLDAATASNTVSTLVLRDAAGRAQFVDPSAAQDAATKSYVDSLVQGLDVKPSVRAATAAAFAVTARSSSTLTIGGTTLTIDGIAMANADRVLVKDTPTGTGAGAWDCGIYTVGGIGSSVVLTRATDADAWTELPGGFVFVEVGTANADTGWVCTADQGGTLGTTAVTFTQFAGGATFSAANDPGITGTGVYDNQSGTQFRFRAIKAASSKVVIALATKDITIDVVEASLTLDNLGGTLGIAKGGTGQITAQLAINALAGAVTANRVLRANGTNVVLAQVALATDVTGTLPIGNGGTGGTTAATARAALAAAGTVAANVGDGVATQIDVTHNLGTRDVMVQVYRVASPYETVHCDMERFDTNTVRLRFGTAPTSSQYRVVVQG